MHAQAQLYQEYQQQLLACNSMDFDDLIMLPVQLFRLHSEVLNRWQDKIRYLLIDEYQDTAVPALKTCNACSRTFHRCR